MKEIKSNMTGTVLQLLVKVGDTVQADQDVLSIESMKMEMSLQSHANGVVKAIHVKVEDFIQEGQVVLTLE